MIKRFLRTIIIFLGLATPCLAIPQIVFGSTTGITLAQAHAAFSGAPPITYNSGTGQFACTNANSATTGCITAVDFSTFNTKLSTANASYIWGVCSNGTFAAEIALNAVIANKTGTGNCAGGYVVQNLTTGGPQCVLASVGSGTVTNIATNNGVTGGPITTTGTLSLDTAYAWNAMFGNGTWGHVGNCVNGTVQNLTATGVQCIALTAGPQGPQGIPGTNGTNGADGATGPQGPMGLNGTNGTNGVNGTNGLNGTGIASTVLLGNGSLSITLTNGTVFITANITGATGATGSNGLDGIGIASVLLINNGSLRVNLTNGTSFITGNITGATGAQGLTGNNGVDGTGIASILLIANGSLRVNMTNGTNFITGNITGATGATGNNGLDGAGIASVLLLTNGSLRVNLTNGTNFITGNITGATGAQGIQGNPGNPGTPGADGAGIASVLLIANGSLRVNMTNGTNFITGNITGATGATGPEGPMGLNGTNGLNGTSYQGGWVNDSVYTNTTRTVIAPNLCYSNGTNCVAGQEVDPFWGANYSSYKPTNWDTTFALLGNGTFATTLLLNNVIANKSSQTDMANVIANKSSQADLANVIANKSGIGNCPADQWVQNLTSGAPQCKVLTPDWAQIETFPDACPAGKAVTQIDSTLTCTAFASSTILNNVIANKTSWAEAVNGTIVALANIGNWTAEKANYALQATLANTIGNKTSWSNVANGTMALQVDLASTIGNSTSWDKVMNGTVAGVCWANSANGTLAFQSDLAATIGNKTAWANVVNGTVALWSQVMNGTVSGGGITWGTATNGTLATWLQVMNGTVGGAETNWNANYTTYNKANWDTAFTLLGNATFAKQTDLANVVGNKTTWAEVMNGTVGGSSWTTITNGTMASWLNVVNGTMAFQSDIAVLTANKTTWAEVTNGTMAAWWQISNGTLALQSTLASVIGNKTSWLEVTNGTMASWPQVINGTIPTWDKLTNGTLISWYQAPNGTIRALIVGSADLNNSITNLAYWNSTGFNATIWYILKNGTYTVSEVDWSAIWNTTIAALVDNSSAIRWNIAIHNTTIASLVDNSSAIRWNQAIHNTTLATLMDNSSSYRLNVAIHNTTIKALVISSADLNNSITNLAYWNSTGFNTTVTNACWLKSVNGTLPRWDTLTNGTLVSWYGITNGTMVPMAYMNSTGFNATVQQASWAKVYNGTAMLNNTAGYYNFTSGLWINNNLTLGTAISAIVFNANSSAAIMANTTGCMIIRGFSGAEINIC